MITISVLIVTIRDDLLLTVEKLVNRRKGELDHIFIEPSGLADPGMISLHL